MRLVSVSGTRGSGKTSLIRELISRFGSLGMASGVIVNEDGEAIYDQDFIRAHNLHLAAIRGG